jgi:geranylgeranyl transferase type-2 subunit alpha
LPLMLESRLPSSQHSVGSEENTGRPSPAARYKESLVIAREEWENILLNAIFTEPDDQTPWWYHRFIVSWAKPSADVGDEMVMEYETLLFEMADSLRDLLEVEKENDTLGDAVDRDESKGAKCKWAYIGLHMVLCTLLESKTLDEGEAADLREEAGECLTELIKIDPNRRERYQNLAAEAAETTRA